MLTNIYQRMLAPDGPAAGAGGGDAGGDKGTGAAATGAATGTTGADAGGSKGTGEGVTTIVAGAKDGAAAAGDAGADGADKKTGTAEGEQKPAQAGDAGKDAGGKDPAKDPGKEGDGKGAEPAKGEGDKGKEPGKEGEVKDPAKDALKAGEWPKELPKDGLPPDTYDRLVALMPADQQEKAREFLKTRASPVDILKAAMAAQSKITELTEKGKGLVKVPGKDATAEEVAAYRKATGVPEKVDDYKIDRGKDFKVEPALQAIDNTVTGAFLKVAHEANLSQSQVDALVKLDMERSKIVESHLADLATQAKKAGEDDLRIHFGVKKFEPMVSLAQRTWDKHFAAHFGDAKGAHEFMQMRTMDGVPFGSKPGIVKALATLGLMIEDQGAFIDGEAMTGKDLDTEIAEIKKTINTDKYTDAMATRLSKLLEQQGKQKKAA